MTDLKRLDEAVERAVTKMARWKWESIRDYVDEPGRVVRQILVDAGLANGERVEPDYEAAYEAWEKDSGYSTGLTAKGRRRLALAIDAAVAGRTHLKRRRRRRREVSDRRPEKLYMLRDKWDDEPLETSPYVEASPADLVAAVRRGVKSGTIEGMEVQASIMKVGEYKRHVIPVEYAKPGTYLVIWVEGES